MRRAKRLLVAAVGLWPASSFKNWALGTLGYTVARSARIGPCLILGVNSIILKKNASIGPFNVFRDLESVHMDEFAVIGQWNWVSAAAPLVAAGGSGSLSLGQHSALTSRHYVDASGGISIGSFSTVAGVRSTFITHGIDWKTSEQTTRGIEIGEYCLVSSNTSIAPGTRLADRCVTGMGATLAGELTESESLYVAPRAGMVKTQLSGEYFRRSEGFVSPRAMTYTAEGDSQTGGSLA
jgi:UDP-3-O-[3-hydroxymyristoyl] glucosamine N-acyltransferase